MIICYDEVETYSWTSSFNFAYFIDDKDAASGPGWRLLHADCGDEDGLGIAK